MIRILICLALIALLMASSPLSAQDASQETSDSDRDIGGIILVVGAAGTDEYGEQFEAWARKWEEVARLSDAPLKSIGRDDKDDTTDRDKLANLIRSVKPEGASPLWVVLIGHGTFTRGVAKFNLRGPDVSATEISQWLQPVQRPVVIVNCASASGPFVNRLTGRNRIVVTSTKSGIEQNYARFGEYFANAIASPDSDLDHDDEVSVHEAFLRASADVRVFYEAEGRIATEHALIDDNGDGKGTPATMFRGTRPTGVAKDGSQLDGSTAARVTLSPAGARLEFTAEELQQRAAIEAELDELRKQKDSMTEEAYDAALEPRMVRLAKIYQAAESRTSRDSTPNE